MEADRQPGMTRRVGLTLGCFALVAIVAFVDSRASEIAFSIFYVVPIVIAAWYGDRVTGLLVAVASGLGGLVADLVSLDHHLFFTLVNLVCRLVLFVLIAALVSRLKETREREQHLAELEHEAAERLQELNDIKDALMRSVIVGAREPSRRHLRADRHARVRPPDALRDRDARRPCRDRRRQPSTVHAREQPHPR